MLDKFKDECGVFGIFGHPEAANLTYLGLYALQHRGQESAGIAASDGEQLRVSRAMGYVDDAFDDATRSASLPGHVAIGHVRYSTAGESRLSERAADSDRLRARTDRDLPQRQPGQRAASCATSSFATGLDLPDRRSDTEVVLHLYARSRGADGRRGDRRGDLAGAGAFSLRAADEGSADRRARSARLPAARARPPRRRRTSSAPRRARWI